MLPWRFLNKTVVLRELLPLEMDQPTRADAVLAAGYLAHVIGSAHESQINHKERKRWLETLKRERTKNLRAPSWLWSSVVELVVHHEFA
jgi:hypothetical protein